MIEIIELICKAGGVYCTEVADEYHIDRIIDELTEFLRFIREMTSNYSGASSQAAHNINRNNSISILFLLCRLIIFKENDKCIDDETVPAQLSSRPNESFFDLDISQRLKRLNVSNQPFDTVKNLYSSSNTIDEVSSVSTLGNYVTATENMAAAAAAAAGGGDVGALWKKELQIALLDYPLKHFYPQVVDLISYALKVRMAILFCHFIFWLCQNESTNFFHSRLNVCRKRIQ